MFMQLLNFMKVKACFAILKFNSEPWLSTLSASQASEYLKLLEKNRNVPKQIEATVTFIKEFQALEDLSSNVCM